MHLDNVWREAKFSAPGSCSISTQHNSQDDEEISCLATKSMSPLCTEHSRQRQSSILPLMFAHANV